MTGNRNTWLTYLGFLVAIFVLLTVKSASAQDSAIGLPLVTPLKEPPAQEVEEEPAQEVQPEAPTEPIEETPIETAPTPAAPPQNQTVIYAVPAQPAEAQPAPPANPWADLRKLPKKLYPKEGEAPPFGYVEVVKRKRGLVIGGSGLFGGSYLFCLVLSTVNRELAIPIIGPAIAGFSVNVNDDFWGDSASDARFSAGLFGMIGTIAQAAGITMLAFGIASKKKMWLRQDIAGVSFQLTPTLVGRNDPGLGMIGTF